ncbi:MAG TPA: YjjG family noncanonical pyrimidine nucleotidase [Flavilitoribacter sp.]|nr:YjjG family noncanonical pyrimidine nucleotidase [Flavilitoribacter sp.]HMQ88647.1 YjjG family noncanonical pyrimidine nucleotidase [Flavilitoribacter sp.]
MSTGKYKYDWIIFDADNTLFDFTACEKAALKGALENLGVYFQDSHHDVYHIINKSCWHDFETGRITRAELRLRRFELFFAEIGLKEDLEAFAVDYLGLLAGGTILLPGAEALLNSLHGEFGLALATNGLKEVQRPRLVKSGLTSFFKVIVVSDEIGHAKPDAGFFDHAFHEMGRPDPGRVLMVGDNLNADILGSMSYGIDACWFNPDRLQPYLDIEPDYQIHDLSEVLKLVNSAER